MEKRNNDNDNDNDKKMKMNKKKEVKSVFYSLNTRDLSNPTNYKYARQSFTLGVSTPNNYQCQ
ncbi:MAG: hypothetical protein JO297_02050 [Nitrososphaeraceae archaeon]|nr:hypothetical protein [Nitrososphaeraceae archaeon]